MKNIALIASVWFAFSTQSFAQRPGKAAGQPKAAAGTPRVASTGTGETWGPPYGMAGCGLGGYAVGNHNTKLAQLGATSLNGYSSNQSFGITSGTSNCEKNSPTLMLAEQEVFISANRTHLAAEAAQGSGETLAAFLELIGCNQSEADARDAADFCRENLSIFQQGNAKEVLNSFKTSIRKDARGLADRCLRV